MIIAAVTVILGLLAMLGAGELIRRAARGQTYSDAASIPHRRVGVLLGCVQRLSDGRANLFFNHRIAAAAQLFNARKIDYIIVSGDNHTVGYDESTAMKNALMAAGVPAGNIYCDFAGFRTLDSVVRAREVFGQTSFTLISQEFHNQRAIYIARGKGLDAIGFNAKDVNSRHSIKTMIREQFARVRTVLDVNLLGTRPKFLGPRIEIGEVARDDTSLRQGTGI
ncbi:MAG: protein SanA [Verrucomicrobia bacterium]|nr:protein SanA [Verrucomicrobiota bacterium]